MHSKSISKNQTTVKGEGAAGKSENGRELSTETLYRWTENTCKYL